MYKVENKAAENVSRNEFAHSEAVYEAYWQLEKAMAAQYTLIRNYGFDDEPSECKIDDICAQIEDFRSMLYIVTDYIQEAKSELGIVLEC